MQTRNREPIIREKRKFWKAHDVAWQNSGYSLAEYCRHHDLVYHRLIYWKTKFANEQPKPVSFVPVPLRTQPTDTAIIMSLRNDRFKIAIGTDFSDDLLGRLIATLESL